MGKKRWGKKKKREERRRDTERSWPKKVRSQKRSKSNAAR